MGPCAYLSPVAGSCLQKGGTETAVGLATAIKNIHSSSQAQLRAQMLWYELWSNGECKLLCARQTVVGLDGYQTEEAHQQGEVGAVSASCTDRRASLHMRLNPQHK